jgi:hypothetical protein
MGSVTLLGQMFKSEVQKEKILIIKVTWYVVSYRSTFFSFSNTEGPKIRNYCSGLERNYHCIAFYLLFSWRAAFHKLAISLVLKQAVNKVISHIVPNTIVP